MKAICPTCGNASTSSVLPDLRAVVRPWRMEYRVHVMHCYNCHMWFRRVEMGEPDHRVFTWSGRNDESIEDQGEFLVDLSRNYRLPLEIFWLYHPMKGNQDYEKLIASYVNSHKYATDKSMVLVAPNWFDMRLFEDNWGQMHQVVHLSEVITSDACGPYPSMRADYTINEHWGDSSLTRVHHFWPSAIFKPEHMVYFTMEDPEKALIQEWIKHARLNVELQLKARLV